MNTKIDEKALMDLNALDAFNKYFGEGGYRYGDEEKRDAQGWFVAGFASRHAQAETNETFVGGGVPEGFRLLRDTTYQERSFSDDARFENGNYENCCSFCGRNFRGHKRRVICKTCVTLNSPPSTASVPAAEKQEDSAPMTDQEKKAFAKIFEGLSKVQDLLASARERLEQSATPPSQAKVEEPVRGVSEGIENYPVAFTSAENLKYLKKGEGYRAVVWFPETDRNDLPLYLQPPPAFVEDKFHPHKSKRFSPKPPLDDEGDVGHWYADGSMVMSQGSDEDGNLNVADCWDEAVAQRIVALHNAAPPPHTAAPDTLAADARDAARYRFLRSREAMLQDDLWERIGDKEDESFDSAVDTAMARTPTAGVKP